MNTTIAVAAGAETLAQRWYHAIDAIGRDGQPQWLRALRAMALEEFRAGGLPHRKVEAWKYTPLKILDGFDLQPDAVSETVGTEQLPRLVDDAPVIDCINGAPAGRLPELVPGVTLLSLVDGIESFEDRLKPLFETVELSGATHAFAALNTICADRGVVIHVAAGVDAGALAIRWASAGSRESLMHNARLILLMDEGARLQLVEQHRSAEHLPAGLNLLTQVELQSGAVLEHTRVQAESDQAVLLTSTRVEQQKKSRYAFRGFDLGAALARHEIDVTLAGEDASTDIAGAFVLGGRCHVDNHVSVEHRAPDCASEQFFRGVLGGRSRGVFNGRALINPGADGASVRQSNANLLLSPLAEMDTKPELEIYADEVEASHGATVGQLDENAVFYLRTRGLSAAAARRLLTAAHCRAVTERVGDRILAGRIAEMLDGAMPDSEL